MDFSDPPMELGEVLKGKDADGNLINGDKLGQIYTFPASRLTSNIRGGKDRFTGKPITAILLRNETGFTLLGKRLARLSRAAGYGQTQAVDGYCAVLADQSLVFVDGNLPSTGVPDDDIFWGIINGPTLALTPFEEGGVQKTVAAGDWLVGATGSTTGTSGVGRVACAGILAGGSLAATDAYAQAANRLARALSARTTGETNSDILVDACIRL